MKKIICLLAICFIFSLGTFSQNNSRKCAAQKGALVGIQLNALDFITPPTWKDRMAPRRLASFSNMDYGFSLTYWKGWCSNIDFAVKLNGMMHKYAADRNEATTKTEFGLEIEPTVNIRAIEDKNLFSPFLTAGLGTGLYTGKLGAYVPAGVGVQFNFNSTSYLMVQANYRFALAKDVLNDHLVYSLGFMHSISPEKPAVIAPPPPPPPPVVLDRDNDGVNDEKDKCPDVPGLASLSGCPDKDKDGIADRDDKCPDVAGTQKYNGCPIPDSDNDGINDEQDKCPAEKGVARYQGCPIPDTDKDGVNDEKDKCPDVLGDVDNDGCPKLESIKFDDGKETYTFAATDVQFQLGSANLTIDAKKELDKLIKLLNIQTKLGINIGGHTDNTGAEAVNQSLSQKRAEAVKAYLTKAGIADSRLSVTGYGSSKPIADNKTAEGRNKNRRVEFSARQ